MLSTFGVHNSVYVKSLSKRQLHVEHVCGKNEYLTGTSTFLIRTAGCDSRCTLVSATFVNPYLLLSPLEVAISHVLWSPLQVWFDLRGLSPWWRYIPSWVIRTSDLRYCTSDRRSGSNQVDLSVNNLTWILTSYDTQCYAPSDLSECKVPSRQTRIMDIFSWRKKKHLICFTLRLCACLVPIKGSDQITSRRRLTGFGSSGRSSNISK